MRCCELTNKKNQQMYKVTVQYLDDHQFNELLENCENILTVLVFGTIWWTRHSMVSNKICTSSHQWKRVCDKRLALLISHIHHTFQAIMSCGTHSTTMQVGLVSEFCLGNLEDSKSTSLEFGVCSEITFVAISWMCKKQTSVSHSSTESEIISRQNPAKDCGADRVLSSFAGCGGACLQCFVPGHGPTTLTRLQKCVQDVF